MIHNWLFSNIKTIYCIYHFDCLLQLWYSVTYSGGGGGYDWEDEGGSYYDYGNVNGGNDDGGGGDGDDVKINFEIVINGASF